MPLVSRLAALCVLLLALPASGQTVEVAGTDGTARPQGAAVDIGAHEQ